MNYPAHKSPPVLKHFANLWTLTEQPSPAKEWSLEEKFRQVKKNGFQAVGTGLQPELLGLSQKYELDIIPFFDANLETYREKLEAAAAIQPVRCNIQLCDHDTPPKEAVSTWLKLEALAKKLNLVIDLEVHRDTCTETPEKVYEIAALYKKATGKKIRFCWDFSHFAVVKHLYAPFAKRLLDHPDLVQLARQLHFRPFNGHHCQIPVTDGKGHDSAEIGACLDFFDAVFACWLQGAKGGEALYVCPELGPPAHSYGLYIFPNVWKDAINLRAKIDVLWKKNIRKWRA